MSGCGPATCPEGYTEVGGACVAPEDAFVGSMDASLDAPTADTALDAPRDARGAADVAAPSDGGSDAPLPDAFLAIDGCTPQTFYADNDHDGFGNAALSILSCDASVSGYVLDATDCDDECDSCHPGGSETCDMRDNDCAGGVDDGVLTTFYADCDHDTVTATGALSVLACSLPASGPASCPSGGWVTAASAVPDCDDTCAVCFPGNPEVCDERDNNCDLVTDEGVRTTFVADCDSDGYTPSGAITLDACTTPASPPGTCPAGVWRTGASATTDCNDSCPSCHPGGTEVCDGLDQDCTAGVDNGVLLTFYADCDGDTYTPTSPTTTMACSLPATRPPGAGCSSTGVWRAAPSAMTDCWDFDANARPGQTAYFTSPPSGRSGGLAYDYNCNTMLEAGLTTLGGNCPGATTNGVCGVSGWTSATTVPTCDATADYVDCIRGSYAGIPGHYTCSGPTRPRHQECH
ncbi:MAG: putative metal-binding motif-containing protein [Sandaracinaceae bacterium]|nr:putative metal-binding motif-containing protein [Sandaracinaceae bacterium]